MYLQDEARVGGNVTGEAAVVVVLANARFVKLVQDDVNRVGAPATTMSHLGERGLPSTIAVVAGRSLLAIACDAKYEEESLRRDVKGGLLANLHLCDTLIPAWRA